VLEDPEKLFSKLTEEAEEVIVPSETPEPSEEIRTH
jgi:phosphoribosyl-ATP pyrophosphohydrolase